MNIIKMTTLQDSANSRDKSIKREFQVMKKRLLKIAATFMVFSALTVSSSVDIASAESVPEWVKSNALWYGQGIISEAEFLNAIKFLIQNDIIILDVEEKIISEIVDDVVINATVLIPNGNFDVSGVGFYSPLNLEIPVGTTVTWANEDSVPHNIQSLDESGKVSDIFNSPPLNTGDRFEFTFEESGIHNYYCSFHPWRVGSVTIK